MRCRGACPCRAFGGRSWKLNPQCSVGGVLFALQESRADVCTKGGPAGIGCDAQDEISSHAGKRG